jgi:D-glycero-D-manno-heptose 1,7-bisphosphate phosphatase
VVLLDRDGVINRNLDLGIRSRSEFEFLPGALEGLKLLSRAGALIVVVTNQANIGRGLLSSDELWAIHEAMLVAIEGAGGHVDAIYVCPHRPEDGCDCRKPLPGMLVDAAADFGFDIAEAWMVGDHPRDVEAAERAGCRAIVITGVDGLASGEPRTVGPPPGASDAEPARVPDLAEAARLILLRTRGAGT